AHAAAAKSRRRGRAGAGTTGIQGLDLLGRKVMAEGGAALALLGEELAAAIARAERAGFDAPQLSAALNALQSATQSLAQTGIAGAVEEMLSHSADYLELMSI